MEGRYQPLTANERGHYPIPPLQIELGIWRGYYQNVELPWLRCWDSQGNLLLTGQEQVQQSQILLEEERLRSKQAETLLEMESQRAEMESQRAERLAEKLKELGINPETLEQ